MQSWDCFFGQNVINGDATHDELVHIFVEWVYG